MLVRFAKFAPAISAGNAAWALALLVTTTCATAIAQAQSVDTVYSTKGGTPAKGTVTAITKNEITLDMAGVPRTFATNEIQRVVFGDEPGELSNARNAVLQKNYNSAIEELKKIPPANLTREFMRQDAAYFRAFCDLKMAVSEGGDKTKAEADMLNFLRAAPDSYHFYEAAELLGDLAVASGKYENAERYYGSIARAPFTDYQMRSNNAVGRAMVAQGKFAEALTKFEAVLAGDASNTEATQQKQLASIGKAQCLAETGKPDEGIKMIEDIIAKNDPQDAKLFARAYNALGACQLKANRPKEALLAYLHTDVLFYADGDAHAEALYNLTKLWTSLNKSDRATQARNTLRERYAGSLWNAKE
jgi:tetratricopeptide (TPR) repeat protein